MKWIKYPSNLAQKSEVQFLLSEFGPAGLGVYILAMGQIAQQLEGETDISLTYPVRTWMNHFCMSDEKKMREILIRADELQLLKVKMNDQSFTISCEILLEYADDYLNKLLRANKKRKKSTRNAEECPDNVRTMYGECTENVRTNSGQTPDNVRTMSGQGPETIRTISEECPSRIDQNREDQNIEEKSKRNQKSKEKSTSDEEPDIFPSPTEVKSAFQNNIFYSLKINQNHFEEITNETAAALATQYPHADLFQEFRRMERWIEEHHPNLYSPERIENFIDKWLSRANKGEIQSLEREAQNEEQMRRLARVGSHRSS